MIEPTFKILNVEETGNELKVLVKGLDVCFINALRRTILSDLEVVVFKTSPYEENKCIIKKNTILGIHNQIIEHRLSGIPIHITDFSKVPLQNYLLELNVENITDTILYVTTANFKIKNIITDKYLSEIDTKNIFPPASITGDYIDFVPLRPKISDEIPGEAIHLTCEFSKEKINNNGMYSTVSTCSLEAVTDNILMEKELAKKIQKWRDEEMSKQDIEMNISNWKLLEGKRITSPNTFNLIVESIGVYENTVLVEMACDVIIQGLNELNNSIENDSIRVERPTTITTIPNCFDIHLVKNEDYTLGKILEHLLFTKFYLNKKTMTFCGFKKFHPHDPFTVLRIAYINAQEKSTVLQNLRECILSAISVFEQIQKYMNSANKNKTK